MFNKIQVIKLVRDLTGKSLREAKDIVDTFECELFEEKVVRALGEDARQELRNWARIFVNREERKDALKILDEGEVIPFTRSTDLKNIWIEDNEPEVQYPDLGDSWDGVNRVWVGCDCDDCSNSRLEDQSVPEWDNDDDPF